MQNINKDLMNYGRALKNYWSANKFIQSTSLAKEKRQEKDEYKTHSHFFWKSGNRKCISQDINNKQMNIESIH